MPTRTLLATVVVLLLASFAAADMMYEWVDKNGSVTLRDTPPPTIKSQKGKIYQHSTLIATPSPKSATAKPKGPAVLASQKATKKEPFAGTVELYVTSWCGYCRRAQEYLKERQVPYVAYDIEKDSAAAQRHKQLGGNGVPLIIVGSNKIHGFSPAALEQYLGSGQ